MMVDPFTAWSRMISAGFDMQRNWLNFAETLGASASVIRVRSALIEDAGRSPFTADVAELSRMVPEKVDAFTRSGQAMMADLAKMQAAWWLQAQRLSTMALAGRAPTLVEFWTFAGRTQNYALDSTDAHARLARVGLAPVHKTATANARRLGRSTRTR